MDARFSTGETVPACLLGPSFEGLAYQSENQDVVVGDAATFNGLETFDELFNSLDGGYPSYVSGGLDS